MDIGKSGAVIGWKRIGERTSFVYNLWAVQEFFLSVEGGVRSFDKSGFKTGLRTRSIFIRVQVRVQPILASPSSSSSSEI